MSKDNKSRLYIYVSLLADLAIAAVKFIAAAATGSAAMFSEGVHSFVDTGNSLLLLFGMKESKKPADEIQNFGHGREIYFWSIIVSLLLFTTGGGLSIYTGVRHLIHPSPLVNLFWNFVVLGFSFILEGLSFYLAYKNFSSRKTGRSIYQAIVKSTDASAMTIIIDNIASIAGIVIAFAGIALSAIFENPYIDGIASVIIGLLLCASSTLLIRECKKLLLGESLSPFIIQKIKTFSAKDPDVEMVMDILTMQLGPEEVLLAMDVNFKNHLVANDIQSATDRLEDMIRKEFPDIKKIFIRAESKVKYHIADS
jgi:cation diffusion facilitator family transporter